MKYFRFFSILLFLFAPYCYSNTEPGMALYNTGWNQIYAKQYKKAGDSFAEALKQLPENKKWLAIDGQGWSAYYLGKYIKAKRIFTNNIEANPNASYSYKGLGFVLLQLKEFDKAYLSLEKAFELEPKQQISDYFFVYNAFIANKEYSYASNILNIALTAYPDSADINFYLAKSLLLSGDQSKPYNLLATASYYEPVKISSLFNTLKNVDLKKANETLINMGWGLYVSEYFSDALFRFNQSLENNSNDPNALRGKGFSLLRLKQYQESEKVLETALRQDGHKELSPVKVTFISKTNKPVVITIDTETMLAWAKYYLGDYITAKNLFAHIVDSHPEWINARLGLAYTQKALGENYQETVDKINQEAPGYISYIPEYSSHALTVAYKNYNDGWSNIFAEKYKLASQNFNDADKYFPNNLKWLAEDGKAWIEYYKGHNKVAKDAFEKIIKNNPYASLSYKGLGYVMLKENKYKDAYDNVIKMLRLNPAQSKDTFDFLISHFIDAKQYEYAQNILKTALYYYPKSGSILMLQAKVYWETNQKSSAYNTIKSSSYYDPVYTKNYLPKFKGLEHSKLGDSLLHVAWGLYANKDYEKALSTFNEFYKDSPKKEPLGVATLNAIRGQGFCLLHLNKFEQAANKLEKVLESENATYLKPVSSTFYTTTGYAIPVYVDASTSLGWAYYSLGKYKQAEDKFRDVLTRTPSWINARLGLAYTLKASGNASYQNEVDIINKYAPGYGVFIPDLPANISQRAFTKYNNAWADIFAKKYDSAFENFTAAKNELAQKDKWLANDGIAWIAYNKGDYKSALSQFQNIIKKNQNATLSYKGLTYCYLQLHNYGKAFDSVEKLIKIQPSQGLDVYSYVANAFMKGNQRHFAREVITKGLGVYPESGDLKFYKAQLLWDSSKRDQAYKLISEAAKVSPLTVDYGLETLKGLDYRRIKDSLIDLGWGLYLSYKNKEALRRFNQYSEFIDFNKPLSLKDLDAIRGQGFCYIRLEENKKAKDKLELVLANKKSSQLKPIVSYFYPKNQKAILVYTDSLTNLGWAQFALTDYKDAENSFLQVISKHSNWINARLGLAYVYKSTKRPELAEAELKKINTIAPGYGVIVLPPPPKAWSFVYKITAAWYKPDSAKNNSQAYQIDAMFNPNPNISLGAFYNYQHINFRPPTKFVSPARQDRIGYNFTLLKDIDNFGWIGPSGKGNYIFRSAYNDDGANNTYFPYWALTYKTPDLLNTIEVGYAKLKFKDSTFNRTSQKSLMLTSSIIDNWLLGATLYRSTVKRVGFENEKFTAISLNATYYFNSKHNLAGFVMLGRRKQAYGLDINKAYDIRDRQNGSFGITYSYNLRPHIGLFADFSYDRFILDSDTRKKYRAYYFTIGMAV